MVINLSLLRIIIGLIKVCLRAQKEYGKTEELQKGDKK